MGELVTIGIDPGAGGAVALLRGGRFEICADWTTGPAMVDTLGMWRGLFDTPAFALEAVHSTPQMGVTSAFSFGESSGWWKGYLDATGASWLTVSPQTWMRGLVPAKASPKDKPGLLVARRLFPTAPLHLAKHHGRADALLIAYWLFLKLTREGGVN